MTCNHTSQELTWNDGEWDYEGNWIDGEWCKQEVPSTVDLDLHQYQCTQCRKIMYYSGAAKQYYKNNITTNIIGLDK